MDGATYPAMTNIGTRPTLDNGSDVSIETHILDFNGDLYGQSLTLQFIYRLRDEMRFENLDALIRQLHTDAEKARQILVAR